MYVCIHKSEVSPGCHSSGTIHLLFYFCGTVSHRPGAHQVLKGGWPVTSTRDLPTFIFLLLFKRGCRFKGSTQVLMLVC